MTTAVILGAAVWADGPSPTLLRRVRHGAALYHRGDVTRIVVCGGLGRHPPSEAEVMRDILRDAGVPEAVIVLEDQSTTTAENLRNARPLVGDTAVVIVSDLYHLPRACLVARRLGMAVRGSAPPRGDARVWPQVKGALREIPAYLLYWVRFRPG